MDNAYPSHSDAARAGKPAPASGTAVETSMPRLSTSDLFRGARELVLLHNGREYHLRITQQGKLLLTA